MTAPVPGITPRAWPPPQNDVSASPLGAGQVRAPEPAAEPVHDTVRIADFSYTPPPLRFTMDGETYECFPMVSAALAQDIAKMASGGLFARLNDRDDITPENVNDAMNGVASIFRVLMKPQSAERFVQRLTSRDEPLDINRQVVPLLHWLLEQYGVRPTAPAPDSSSGSPGAIAGTTSTGGASYVGSTQGG